MPKRPIDKGCQNGLRIELQESERDMLRAFLVGKTVTNAASAVAPVAAAVATPLIAWGVAQFTAQEFKDFLNDRVGGVRETYVGTSQTAYDQVTATFQIETWATWNSETGLNRMRENIATIQESIENPYWRQWREILFQRAEMFIAQFTNNPAGIAEAERQGMNPAGAWVNFYPQSEFENDVIYTRKTGGVANWGILAIDFITSPFR